MIENAVKDIHFKEKMSSNELIKELHKSGGFTAKKVAVGLNVIENMIMEKDCVRFLSFPACICATGTRGVIKELLKRKLFDVVITTCGTLDHDLARIWKNYYHGFFKADDGKLYKEGVNRLGNIFIPNESYGKILEEKMQPILAEIYKKSHKWSTKELIWEFGKHIENVNKSEDSIIYWSWKNKIPIYVPGITDGAFGS
ncbi:MAG: deoxyhypusine synthase family protein, partial [Thermoplasmatales archaeon]